MLEYFCKVLHGAGSAGSNDGYVDRFAHFVGDVEGKSILGAIVVHGGEQNLTGSSLFTLQSPVDSLSWSGGATTMDVDHPLAALFQLGVDGQHNTLTAKLPSYFGNELGVVYSGTVDAYLVGSRLDDGSGIFECADTASNREGDVDGFGYLP